MGARYEREGSGVSFERVALFTDAVFAIALTLIVVGIGVPAVSDASSAGALWDALWEQAAEVVSFFLGVVVVGFYWRSHHMAFAQLRAVDDGYALRTVFYLAFVAFLPFPISLVGEYPDNPVSWTAFALNLAAVSGMETVLLLHAQRADLLLERGTPAQDRWAAWMSALPVLVFLASIAVAFVVPYLTCIVWVTSPFLQVLVSSRIGPDAAAPEGAG